MLDLVIIGGQIMDSSEIENYPGQISVMSEIDLMQTWTEQAMQLL